MEQAVRELHDWAAKELGGSRRDEPYLKMFLHGCKMRQDVARNKMKNFHALRLKTPQWFADRDPNLPIIKDLLDLGAFLLLPKKDEGGRTVVLTQPTLHNPSTVDMTFIFKVGMMILDLAMEGDASISEHGVIVIADLTGVQAGHALQLKPNLVRRAVHSWQDCYPVRIHSFHFINCPGHVWIVLNIFKQFMREKLKRRVHTYGQNYTALFDTVPRQLIPNEQKGTLGPIQECIAHWKKKVTEARDWYLAQDVGKEEVSASPEDFAS